MKRFNWLFCVLVMALNMVACEKTEMVGEEKNEQYIEEQEVDIVENEDEEIQFECAEIEAYVREELGLAEGSKIDGQKLEQIEMLDIAFYDNTEPVHIAGDLQHFTELKILRIYVEPKLGKEMVLDYDVCGTAGELQKLEELYIRDSYLEDISFVANLGALKRLYIPETNVSDISVLKEMKQLTHLSLYDTPIKDVTPIGGLTDLVELSLAYCDEIENIEIIASMSKMESLGLMGCGIEDISFLKDMTKLHSLNLSENRIKDITLLAEFPNLSGVALDDNKITDVSALVGLKNLTFVSLYDNPVQNVGLLVGVDPCFDVTIGKGAKTDNWEAEVKKALHIYDVTEIMFEGHALKVEDYYVGDATGDGLDDVGIVVSWVDKPEDIYEGYRWLYIYPGTKTSYKNPLEPMGLTDGMTEGRYGEPYRGIILHDGKLIVQHEGGSANLWRITEVYQFHNRIWECVLETDLYWQDTWGTPSEYGYSLKDFQKNIQFDYKLYIDQGYQWYKMLTGEYQIDEVNNEIKDR